MRRKRTSQPYGWDNKTYGAVGHFYGARHDYDYYPQAWTASDGRYFEEGYYDENGQHYDNMIMAGGTTMLKCDYCGNRMVYKWTEGELPTCDKCGASFRIDITDKEESRATPQKTSGSGGIWKGVPLVGKIIIIAFLSICIFPTIIIFAAVKYAFTQKGTGFDTGYEVSSVQNSIYVEEIGRTCYLDGEDWYDSQTECWFYYNDSVSPYQWQYWYEGISSDYGDYGWMEYDMGEDAWYIEADEGNWIHLPENYDTSKLWHMTDEYTNAY